ncbi:transposable element Tcb1 transposase [Trichonephila clavipes]|nr:transposable element Tcb1 transposase [Trichonephila clavipes]
MTNTGDEFWNTVIFSDESKFNIFESDGRQYVWRKPNPELEKQQITPTVKDGGGSVLVRGCIAANGVGTLCFIDGIMTARTYIDILRHNLQSSAQKLGLGTSFVFQQDNDPKHTANLTREWLLYNSPRQLKTPPQSPDINPIENLWHKLDVEVRKHKISFKDELKRVLLQEWHKIPNSTTKTLVLSMRNRLQAVINAKGMHRNLDLLEEVEITHSSPRCRHKQDVMESFGCNSGVKVQCLDEKGSLQSDVETEAHDRQGYSGHNS